MHGIRPLRTVVAALLGTVVGGLALAVVAQLVIVPTLSESTTGLTAALVVLQALEAGMVLGPLPAVAVAFRDEPVRARLITAGAWVVPAAVVFVGALQGLIEPVLAAPYVLLPAAVVLMLLGRVIALRTDREQATE